MFNLKNLLCILTLTLCVSNYQAFASTPVFCHAELSVKKYGGAVEIIQLRTGSIKVKINVHGYVNLQLIDPKGRHIYSKTVHPTIRTRVVNTADLTKGIYTLVAFTQNGIFEFDVKVE